MANEHPNQAGEGQAVADVRPLDVLNAVSSIVASQAEDHKLKAKELEIREKELERQSAYAEKALNAQAADRESHRTLFLKVTRDRYWFALGAMLVVFCFMSWLVHENQVDLAKDILKLGLGFAAGGATGFYAGKNKSQDVNRQ